jgi:hypothetical protein
MIAGTHAVLWVRRDRPGNDACRFAEAEGGFLIDGSATDETWNIQRYRVRAREDGTTRRARIGANSRIFIRRAPDGEWTLNGTPVPEVAGALDIDLGFTPATKTLAIRRLNLPVGGEAAITVALFDQADERLKPMRQVYERLGEHEYRLSSPDSGVFARLKVDANGIVRDFERFWRAQE